MNLHAAHVVGLEEKLKLNRPLVVKLGFDPTSPDLHLGHFVVLRGAKRLQDQGHLVHILVGDFTAAIGDPSGRNKLRPPLDRAAIEANAKTYQDQVFKILDEAKTKVSFNSEWLGKISLTELLSMLSSTTLSQILEREDFSTRHQAHVPIFMHEFMYPLMQGQDSVAIKADVELGGTDQLFNLQMGRHMQRVAGQTEQAVVAFPLLVGLDGVKKMSKSLGNYIGITEDSTNMFGKVMSMSDDAMWLWWKVLAEASESEIASLKSQHPMDVKIQLAKLIVSWFHSEKDAEAEAIAFKVRFSKKDLSGIADFTVDLPSAMPLSAFVHLVGEASSKSDAMRKIQQRGVRINGAVILDPKFVIEKHTSFRLEVGKKFAVNCIVN